MEDWWDNLESWVKVLICIVVSIILLALIVLTIIMPIVWSFKFHTPAYLLLWCIPVFGSGKNSHYGPGKISQM